MQTRSIAVAMTLTAALSLYACANTARGIKQDTERAAEKTSAGMETMDVKSALIADGRVDATDINVDTSASAKTVLLKGSVKSAEEKTVAEAIAREHAKGYKIDNRLAVVPK